MAIKAIPTTFAGVHFRSRLEARWAVFFKNIDAEWSYENFTDFNGAPFRLGSVWNQGILDREEIDFIGRYQPDFKISCGDYGSFFVEVKPVMPNETYLRHLKLVAAEIGFYFYPLLLGIGDFKDTQPLILCYPYHSRFCLFRLSEMFSISSANAIQEAAAARFDLL